ncbi:hypothetical protein B566_EDAN016239 [Ephemera danica]|nr:hypothetical protein B566_EDAN016239 [Ephemera danica]
MSLDVTIPLRNPPSFPFSVIGIPQKPCSFLTAITSRIYNNGQLSRKKHSNLVDVFQTYSVVWTQHYRVPDEAMLIFFDLEYFVCLGRRSKLTAIATAISDSVTVSIGEDISGALRDIFFVRAEEVMKTQNPMIHAMNVLQKSIVYWRTFFSELIELTGNGKHAFQSHYDLYGELPTGRGGVKYIFVVLDVFTKFVTLYVIKNPNAKTLLDKIINDFIPKFGRMIFILSDHGSQYTSHLWFRTLTNENITVKYTSGYHPGSNPSERVMRELGRIFRAYCNHKHTLWCSLVPKIMEWINVTTHASTGVTPYELQHGRKLTREIASCIKFPVAEVVPPTMNELIEMATN